MPSHTQLVREISRRMEPLGFNPRSLSVKAGLNPTAIRDIFDGSSPKTATLQKIAKALGCTSSDLTGEKPAKATKADSTPAGSVAIHELDVHVTAGMGADAEDAIMAAEEAGSIVGTFAFPSSGFREVYGSAPTNVRMIAVRGDSMVPALWPGQRCMVDTSDKVPSPPGVFVVWDGLGLVLKRVELIPGSDPQRVRLSSDNKQYQAYERTLEEAHINGRVIGVWARM